MHLNVPKPNPGSSFAGVSDAADGLAALPDVVVVLSNGAQRQHGASVAPLLGFRNALVSPFRRPRSRLQTLAGLLAPSAGTALAFEHPDCSAGSGLKHLVN